MSRETNDNIQKFSRRRILQHTALGSVVALGVGLGLGAAESTKISSKNEKAEDASLPTVVIENTQVVDIPIPNEITRSYQDAFDDVFEQGIRAGYQRYSELNTYGGKVVKFGSNPTKYTMLEKGIASANRLPLGIKEAGLVNFRRAIAYLDNTTTISGLEVFSIEGHDPKLFEIKGLRTGLLRNTHTTEIFSEIDPIPEDKMNSMIEDLKTLYALLQKRGKQA